MKNHRILKPGEMVSEFVANTLKITHADGSDATGDYEVTFMPGKLTVNTVIVNYRVFYYYDGVLDESEIEEGTGEVLTQITEYKDKPKDMQFDHVTGFPLTLGLDEMKEHHSRVLRPYAADRQPGRRQYRRLHRIRGNPVELDSRARSACAAKSERWFYG